MEQSKARELERRWSRRYDLRELFVAAREYPDGDLSSKAISEDCVKLLAEGVANRIKRNGEDGVQEYAKQHATDNAIQAVSMTTWRRCGMPHLIVGAKRTAYYGATRLTTDVEFLPPWPAFLLSINTDVTFLTAEGVERPLRNVLVTYHESGTWHALRLRGSVTLGLPFSWRFDNCTNEWFHPAASEEQDHNRRAYVILMQIVGGIALEFQAHPDVTEAALKRSSSKSSKLKHGPLLGLSDKTYVFAEDVVVDARPVITDFMSKGGKSPTVRSFTRPHARRQHYGPGNSQVKVIRIEGFWRGPKDGPIAVRSHRFQKDGLIQPVG